MYLAVSPVQICLQTRKTRKARKCIYKISKNFRVEKSGEISRNLRFSALRLAVMRFFSCLHLNQTLMMAGMAGFEPTTARVKVWCLTAWRHPNEIPVYCTTDFPFCQYVFCVETKDFRGFCLFFVPREGSGRLDRPGDPCYNKINNRKERFHGLP